MDTSKNSARVTKTGMVGTACRRSYLRTASCASPHSSDSVFRLMPLCSLSSLSRAGNVLSIRAPYGPAYVGSLLQHWVMLSITALDPTTSVMIVVHSCNIRHETLNSRFTSGPMCPHQKVHQNMLTPLHTALLPSQAQ